MGAAVAARGDVEWARFYNSARTDGSRCFYGPEPTNYNRGRTLSRGKGSFLGTPTPFTRLGTGR